MPPWRMGEEEREQGVKMRVGLVCLVLIVCVCLSVFVIVRDRQREREKMLCFLCALRGISYFCWER